MPSEQAQAGAADSILLIDDDRELCELVAELLTEEGFQIETAGENLTARMPVENAPKVASSWPSA